MTTTQRIEAQITRKAAAFFDKIEEAAAKRTDEERAELSRRYAEMFGTEED